ncbi:MAG: hypothetical protein IJH39_04670 [Clostridia bacterium]|nr:hypothetical protein [Clostridia bacterium]
MELHLSMNKKNYIKPDNNTQNFMKDLSNYLNNKNEQNNLVEPVNDYYKEGHLYLVTEDRNGIVFLWDFTEKSKESYEETNLPEELIPVATEGAMLQYSNGKLTLYSPNGYDIVYGEDNN